MKSFASRIWEQLYLQLITSHLKNSTHQCIYKPLKIAELMTENQPCHVLFNNLQVMKFKFPKCFLQQLISSNSLVLLQFCIFFTLNCDILTSLVAVLFKRKLQGWTNFFLGARFSRRAIFLRTQSGPQKKLVLDTKVYVRLRHSKKHWFLALYYLNISYSFHF